MHLFVGGWYGGIVGGFACVLGFNNGAGGVCESAGIAIIVVLEGSWFACFHYQFAGLGGCGHCVGYGGMGMLWGDVGVHMGLVVGSKNSLARLITLRS